MKPRSGWIAWTAALLMAGLPILGTAADHAPHVKKKETRIVKIEGNKGWVNTGIRLRPQDKVVVKGSGSVCFSNQEPQSCVGPEGWNVASYAGSWPYNLNYCDDPIKNANHAGLIANVGNSDFFIGKQKSFSGKSGMLYLGVNDCTLTGKYYYNTGSFTATVTVYRNAIRHR